jgi:tetratricopeptide (TPR) repeat protein
MPLKHLLRWSAATLISVLAFALAWWVLMTMEFSRDMTLAFAPVVSAAVLAAGGWYAEQGRLGRRSEVPPLGELPPGRVLLGDIPREPPAFQPRKELLSALMDQVGADRVAVVCALTGARGVGKTQLAAAYARRRIADGWPVVVWINAEDPAAVVAALAELAGALGVRGPAQDAALAAAAARQWLEHTSASALLVFDNALDPDDLARWLPRTGRAQTVITSTTTAFSLVGTPVDVGVFSLAEAAAFLAERSGRTQDADAYELAGELDCLPLALAQAAWLIRAQGLTFATYRQRLHDLPVADLLPRVPGDSYPRGSAETVLLASSNVELDPAPVRAVADVIAVLSPSGAYREVLYAALPERGRPEIDAALAALVSVSLLSFSLGGDTVVMHRLVQRVLRERAQQDGSLAAAVARATAAVDPGGERVDLVEHVNTLWTVARPHDLQIEDLLDLRRKSVIALTRNHEIDRACSLGEQVLDDHEQVLGVDHPDTLKACVSLANAHLRAGHPNTSVRLHRRIVECWRATKGPDDPGTLEAVNSLGYALEAAGRVGEAVQVHTANLAASLRVNGQDHQTTMLAQINLASCYRSAGEYQDALSLFQKNAADNERAFGAEHPSTLNARGELARMYERVGRHREAIDLHERNIADYERLIPGTDLLWWRRYLALAYQKAGRTQEAVTLLRALVVEGQGRYGPGHPETLTLQLFLARACLADGAAKEAIELFEYAAVERERILGPDSSDTLNARRNTACAYLMVGQVGKAREMLDTVVADYERHLGSDHPYTATAREDLAAARTARQAGIVRAGRNRRRSARAARP